MIKTVLYVPEADNAGTLFAPRLWRSLERRVRQFGGYSVQGDLLGVWTADGRVYQDRNRVYTVVLSSIRQLPAWVATVEWVLATIRQEAVYVEINGAPEIVPRLPTSGASQVGRR